MTDNNENNNTNQEPPETKFPLSDLELRIRNNELSELVKKAYEAVQECCDYADKYHLEFSWNLAYGMGGWYQGNPERRDDDYDAGWRSSSSSC